MKLFELLVILIVVIVIIVIIVYATRKNDEEVEAKKIMAKFPVSQSKPTFLKPNLSRMMVSAPKVSELIKLPKQFDAKKVWRGLIGPPTDQGNCGACWAYSTTSIFSDRVRIASEGEDLNPVDYISPYHLAACMKCDHKTGICNRVCEGHYLDDVLEYLVKNGCYSHNDINSGSDNGTQYMCFHPKDSDNVRLFKGASYYRVNPYSMLELTDPQRREVNTRAIMQEIYSKGPVTAVVKVYNPTKLKDLHKNFYLHKTGVYGHNWGGTEPSLYDGYHAINIIGWGVESINGEEVPYWQIRNSWGTEWGNNGFGKILRGSNTAVIESDIWTLDYLPK